MKKVTLGIFVVLAILSLLWGAVYIWGRQLIYREGKYPGMDLVTEEIGKQYMLDPKRGGVPIFVEESDITNYKRDDYRITEILPQTKLHYAAGKMVRWEEIEGSEDKYLVLKHENGEGKYRVSFADSDLFKEETTVLTWEKSNFPPGRAETKLEKMTDGSAMQLGYDKVKIMIWPGDSVVVLPVWDMPSVSKQDNAGNYLAGGLILRRMKW